MLQAWDKNQADGAHDVYEAVSKQLLHDAGGYLVEMTSSGLCLAAFCNPLDAVAWGASLIEVMKHHQWDEVRFGDGAGGAERGKRCCGIKNGV
jgi:hypothetical protein